jgi:hypothetical protein
LEKGTSSQKQGILARFARRGTFLHFLRSMYVCIVLQQFSGRPRCLRNMRRARAVPAAGLRNRLCQPPALVALNFARATSRLRFVKTDGPLQTTLPVSCASVPKKQAANSDGSRLVAASSQNRCFSPSFCKAVHKFSRNHQRGSFLKTHLFEKTGHFLMFLSKEVRFRIFFSAQQKCIVLRHFSGYLGCIHSLLKLRRTGRLPVKTASKFPRAYFLGKKPTVPVPRWAGANTPRSQGFRFRSEMPGWQATAAGRLFQPSQPRHAFELFEHIEEFESLAQVMSAMAALIKAHSDPGLDKSSIYFTRPARPREDRNPLIWKRGRQKVSRFRAASTAHGGGFWNPIRGSGFLLPASRGMAFQAQPRANFYSPLFGVSVRPGLFNPAQSAACRIAVPDAANRTDGDGDGGYDPVVFGAQRGDSARNEKGETQRCGERGDEKRGAESGPFSPRPLCLCVSSLTAVRKR